MGRVRRYVYEDLKAQRETISTTQMAALYGVAPASMRKVLSLFDLVSCKEARAKRRLQVVGLHKSGYRTGLIASTLGISRHTVRNDLLRCH